MKKLSNNQAMSINGGRTYRCIDCSYKSSNFWSVYGHVISHLLFRSNTYFNALWKGNDFCLTNRLSGVLKAAIK